MSIARLMQQAAAAAGGDDRVVVTLNDPVSIGVPFTANNGNYVLMQNFKTVVVFYYSKTCGANGNMIYQLLMILAL